MPIKVSIITVVFNGEKTISHTIESILNQTYKNIEYIIMDGKSSDGTLDIINKYKDKIDIVVSERDKNLYDAINKGISLATGDIVGLLHSDDFYTDDMVIQRVVDTFGEKKVDSVFADLLYIKDDNLDRVLRYYSAKKFTPAKLKQGIMPPHPTFFVKKSIYEKHGPYKTDYKIAADYEMFYRLLLVKSISYAYIHFPLVKMRVGGISGGGIKNKILINKEVIRAIRDNGHHSNHLLILKKYPVKILEIIKGYSYNILVKIRSKKGLK